MEKQSFWHRLKIRRRISVVDDQSLNELWSFRLSALGLTIVLVLMFATTVAILSFAIIYTPVRSILPGYNQNLREQLMTESQRLDSLSTVIQLQRQYLDVIRNITAGEVSSDSIPPIDSLQLVFQTELLQAKREATEEFVDQYEQKGRDYLQLFDIQNTSTIITMFSPVHGVVTEPFNPAQGHYGVTIQTPNKENVTAVLAGTIVLVKQEDDQTCLVMLQHANYLSIYRNVGYMTKQLGDVLRAGETFGMVRDGLPISLELWKDGVAINPEEIIVF
ncbi:MAG: M23 family metallopeptidase [Paludibacteraceae bacterium]|nr:M23 family metallopeptidase [Paludibacteraceae bacterium]